MWLLRCKEAWEEDEGEKKKVNSTGECLRELLGRAPSREKPPLINLNYMSSLGFIEAGDSIAARPSYYTCTRVSGLFFPPSPSHDKVSFFFLHRHRNNAVCLAQPRRLITHFISFCNQSKKLKTDHRYTSYCVLTGQVLLICSLIQQHGWKANHNYTDALLLI